MRRRRGPFWSHGVKIRSRQGSSRIKNFLFPFQLENLFESLALIHTGSQVSIVRHDMIRYLTEFQKEPICLKAVNQQSLHVLGTGNLTFVMGGLQFTIPVIAVSKVNHSLLLGLDFLNKYVKSLNMQENTVEFLDEFRIEPNLVRVSEGVTPQLVCGMPEPKPREDLSDELNVGPNLAANLEVPINSIDHINSDLVREIIANKLPKVYSTDLEEEYCLAEVKPPIAIASVQVSEDSLDVCLTACPVDDSVLLKVSLGNSSKYPQIFIRPDSVLADSHVAFDYTHIQTENQECDVYAAELSQQNLQLDLADLEDIPNIPIKALPENWRSLPNVVPEVLTVLENYNIGLQTSSNINNLLPVHIETGCSFPRWSQPYTTTEHKRSIIK